MPLSQLELTDLHFSSPNYNVEIWAKNAFWLPEEIAALSLGYDPTDPKKESYKGPNWAGWLEELEHRTRLASRAAKAGQFKSECPPNEAIEWMDEYDIVYPLALKQAVDSFYPVSDRDKVHSLVTRHLVFLLEKERNKVAELQSQLGEQPEDVTPLKLKSYELMIAGMAVVGYTFDPSKIQSKANNEIADDIAKLGHDLTPETIRKHLKAICKKFEIQSRPK